MEENENLIIIVDYEKLCRLCLHSTGAMSDIFNIEGELSLKDLIFSATGLLVTPDDGLPRSVCHKCRYIVELCCELRETVAKSHRLLLEASGYKEIVEDPEDNLENKEPYKPTNLEQDMRLEAGAPIEQELNSTQNTCTETEQRENKNNVHLTSERVRQAAPKHLTCQICLLSYSTVEEVKQHAETHYNKSDLTPYLELKRPYKCEVCKGADISKKQLILHHRQHLNVNPYVCRHPGCTYKGKNRDSLRHHLSGSHGSRRWVCTRCGARFRRADALRQHEARAHSAPRAHRCRRCGKLYRNEFTYKAHLAVHDGPPKWACPFPGCGKAYRARSQLTAHARAHSGAKPHACARCAARYATRSLLNRHMRMHQRSRVSRCDKCPASFSDYGAFYSHRVRAHGPWQPHRCVTCNRGYQTLAKLEAHLELCGAQHTQEQADKQASNLQVAIPTTAVKQITAKDLLEKLKGQSLLVQTERTDHTNDDIVLQDLSGDGLVYIEVETQSDNEQWDQT